LYQVNKNNNQNKVKNNFINLCFIGFIYLFIYLFFQDLISLGNKKILEKQDVFLLPDEDLIDTLSKQFDNKWKQYENTNNNLHNENGWKLINILWNLFYYRILCATFAYACVKKKNIKTINSIIIFIYYYTK
jgi:hypothetical protein